jgi:predicted nucleotidyltransferase component of viral defense system
MDMISYYTDTLYPLQDKVLRLVDTLESPFYLTGGTALSRFYYNHRYSDDLDLFVNRVDNFADLADKLLGKLRDEFEVRVLSRSADYSSIEVGSQLKVDLVNDVEFRFGEVESRDIFSRVDNVENILSNKLSALIGRDDPKDVVDIWVIAKHKTVDWKEMFVSANSKAVGIFPPEVAQKLVDFPLKLIDKIKWVEGKKPDLEEFKRDMDRVCDDMLVVE